VIYCWEINNSDKASLSPYQVKECWLFTVGVHLITWLRKYFYTFSTSKLPLVRLILRTYKLSPNCFKVADYKSNLGLFFCIEHSPIIPTDSFTHSFKSNFRLRFFFTRPGAVPHTSNPRYVGGKDPAWAKSYWGSHLNK
jgi:hypothetical protein